MATKQNLPQGKPQDRVKHPPRWEDDLNPNRGAGETPGSKQPRTELASQDKRVVRALQGFTMDELAQLRVVAPGQRLTPRAVYVDLSDSTRSEVTARGEMIAGEHNLFVPKADVPYELWNRLLESSSTVAPASHGQSETRHAPQGTNEQRGGGERSERRGSGSVGGTQPARRH